ncbi:MAG: hypothetical protein II479_01585, partial [Bacteroidales bacterium]|nr:hypothetical protein [Bacteroidales bacterium]
KTETVTVPPASVNLRGFGPRMDVSHKDGVTDILVSSDSDDIFTYSMDVAKIYLDWFKQLGTDSWEQVQSVQVYPGNGTLASTGTNSWQYTYALPTEPPTGTDATHVEIRVESDSPYTGTDSVGTQTSNGPAEGRSDMIKAVTTPVGSNPFGEGDFRYSNSDYSDKYFDGYVYLLDGATHDDLTDLSFTVRDASGYQFVVPGDHIDSSGSDDWVGFGYSGDEIPASLVEPATVTVSATYEGNTYSKTFEVKFDSDADPITMEILGVEGSPNDTDPTLFEGSGQVHFDYDSSEGVTYTVEITAASVRWIREDDATTEWAAIPDGQIHFGTPQNLDGAINIYFDFEGLQQPTTEYKRLQIQITAHVTGSDGYDAVLTENSY